MLKDSLSQYRYRVKHSPLWAEHLFIRMPTQLGMHRVPIFCRCQLSGGRDHKSAKDTAATWSALNHMQSLACSKLLLLRDARTSACLNHRCHQISPSVLLQRRPLARTWLFVDFAPHFLPMKKAGTVLVAGMCWIRPVTAGPSCYL
jgi:hypothetical protein